jgi:hypothetical protein
MATTLEVRDGSANRSPGDERTHPAASTVKARVFAHLEAHPDLARRPAAIAAALQVPRGSAKRLAHQWRKAPPSIGGIFLIGTFTDPQLE